MTEVATEKSAKRRSAGTSRKSLSSPKITLPFKDGKEFVVIGLGNFAKGMLPHLRVMPGPAIELKTKTQAKREIEWHRKHNPDFDVGIFRLEPVPYPTEVS